MGVGSARPSSTWTSAGSDQTGTDGAPLDPDIGPLVTIGRTSGHMPDSDSPLVDAAAACQLNDQSGYPRPPGDDDCDTGAVPPIGSAYDLPMVLDRSLRAQPAVWFEGGDHRTLVQVTGSDFGRLMTDAREAVFSHHV